jgi:Tol biopolymer transport system component
MKTKLFAVVGMLVMLLSLLPGAVYAAPAAAQVVVPIMGTTPTIVQMTVNAGAGGQSLPHVSGDWVAYWDYSSGESIHFQNLDMGTPSDRTIPTPDGFYDELEDISDNRIVLTRATGSGMSIQMTQINAFGNPDLVVEVSPIPDSLRRRPTIRGDTIAYEDHSYDPSSSGSTEISLSSVSDPAAPAYRLTNDTLVDWFPAVSPDGNAVVWLKDGPRAPAGAWD